VPRAPLRSTQARSGRSQDRMAGDLTPCVGVGPARYRWQHRRWRPRRVPVPPSGDYPVQLRRCRRCGNAHHRPVGPPAESQPILGFGLSRSTNIKILNVCWLPHFVDQFRTSERNSYSAPVSSSAKSATCPSRLPVMWTNGKVWGEARRERSKSATSGAVKDEKTGVQRTTVTAWCNKNVVFIAERNRRRRQRLTAADERLHEVSRHCFGCCDGEDQQR